MSGERRAIVRLDGRRVGELVESEAGNIVTFRYDEAWLASPDAVPVSLTLPLSSEAWVASGLHPFFQNLLPEGWLRSLAVAKLRVDDTDDFGLLLATGADCAGAVEVLPDEEPGGRTDG